ncbi:hypothetical protein ACMSE3_25955 [Bacteroides thetaiotaomicron]|uniref:hypothetical protein n=1 Tax=Bacteroides thetaiotaomicron TaxID=818 RepID=UPI0039C07377
METNKVIAPRQYSNRFFDVMACPVEVLSETFSYHYLKNDEEFEIELPTKECVRQGDIVSRRFTGVQSDLVMKCLTKMGIEFSAIRLCLGDAFNIVPDSSYSKQS